MIVTGSKAQIFSLGWSKEEMLKTFSAALLQGEPVISFDNCEEELGGALLCQALTETSVRVRPLGKSETVVVPSVATMFATGNNLIIQGDLYRRAIVGRLDAGCEKPEERSFDFEPLDLIEAERGKYLAAALTLLKAYFCAGSPRVVSRLGSFEQWSDTVRSTLIWAGLPDPVSTMRETLENDPQRQMARSVMTAWMALLGSEIVSSSDLIARAYGSSFSDVSQTVDADLAADLRRALDQIAGEGNSISSTRVGKWLSANCNKIIDGMKITREGQNRSGAVTWKIEAA